MNSYTISGHGIKKPITVKSHTRVTNPKTTKRPSRRLYVAKRNALVVVILGAAFVSTFYAGAMSTFTSDDWDGIGKLTIHDINIVLPLVTDPYVAKAAPRVLVNGTLMTKAEFCNWAHTTKETDKSFDLATYCL